MSYETQNKTRFNSIKTSYQGLKINLTAFAIGRPLNLNLFGQDYIVIFENYSTDNNSCTWVGRIVGEKIESVIFSEQKGLIKGKIKIGEKSFVITQQENLCAVVEVESKG